MKKTTASILLAALALTASFSVAQAQDRRGGPGPMDFATLDTDGSGEITVEDIEAARGNRFAEMDANGDGQVSEAEFIAHSQAQAAERASAMFARLDADGDGVLSRDVLEAREGGGRMAARMIERADTDNSGGVSAEEFEAVKEKMAGRRGGKGSKRGG